MAGRSGRPPMTLTAHYLAPGRPGPAVDATSVQSGGASRRSTGVLVAPAVAADCGCSARSATGAGERPDIAGAPPELPAFEDCVSRAPDRRRVPGPASDWTFGSAGRRGFDGATDGRRRDAVGSRSPTSQPIDTLALLLRRRCVRAPVFNTELPAAWVPTLELTVHVRGVPAPGPCDACSGPFVHGGMFEEDGECGTAGGSWQSRQLSLSPRRTVELVQRSLAIRQR